MRRDRIDPVVQWVIKQGGLATQDMPFDETWQRELVEKAFLLDSFVSDRGVRLQALSDRYSTYMETEYSVEAFIELLTTALDFTLLRRSFNVESSDLLHDMVAAGGISSRLLPSQLRTLRDRAAAIHGLVTPNGMTLPAMTAWLNEYLGKAGDDRLSEADSSALLRAALASYHEPKRNTKAAVERMAEPSVDGWGISAVGRTSERLVESQSLQPDLVIQIWRQSGPRSYRMDACDSAGKRVETLAETDDPAASWYWFLGSMNARSPRQWADTIGQWFTSHQQLEEWPKYAVMLDRLGSLYSLNMKEPLIRRAFSRLRETAAWVSDRIPGDDLHLDTTASWHPATHTYATGSGTLGSFADDDAPWTKTRSAATEYLPAPAAPRLPAPAAPASLPLFRLSPVRRR